MEITNEDIGKTVKTIDETLEALRYFGKQKDNAFTGECIDISIITLPGLVLDIRIDSLLKWDNNNNICSIGGKATRTAKILWGLVSPEDEIIVPHLITKTSPLGFLMLKNELSENKKAQLFDSKYQDYIFLNYDIYEPRCAARIINENYSLKTSIIEGEVNVKLNGKVKYAVFPKQYKLEQELDAEDLELNIDALNLIREADVILLASMTTPHYKNIFDVIIKNISSKPKKLFLDFSRYIEHDNINQQIKELSENKDKIGGIFFPIDNIELINKGSIELSIHNKFQTLEFPVIIYGDNNKVIYFKDQEAIEIKIKDSIDFLKENVSEAFKAGVLLANAIYSAIDKISERESEEDLKEIIRQGWGSDYLEISIIYGIGLAKYVQEYGYTESYDKFVNYFIKSEKSFDFSEIEHKLYADFKLDMGAKSLFFKHSHFNVLKKICGLRKQNKLSDYTLTHCIENICKDDLCNEKNPKQKRAAVLIDLDGTLIDSENQRKRMISIAFSQIINEINKTNEKKFFPINQTIEIFNKYVYDLWPIYKNAEIGNFRQKWNHPGWYISLIVFYSYIELFNKIKTWYSDNKIEDKNIKYLKEFNINEIYWISDFKKAYFENESKYYSILQNARNKFNQTKIYPYRNAIDFLLSLQQTQAYELYVVTEGEPETQWMKIVNSGLDIFFDRNHVLTTSDAGESSNEIEKIEGEKKLLEIEGENAKYELEKAKNSLDKFHKLEDDVIEVFIDDEKYINKIREIVMPHSTDLLKIKNQTNKKIIRIRKLLYVAEFAREVINRLSQKGGKAFYSAVIRAILMDQKNALSELRSFENLMNDVKIENKMKFVMIGDRQDNDIGWPKALLGDKLLAIRLISGKYAKDPDQNEEKTQFVEDKRKPDYIVHTLSQAKLLLLNKKVWSDIKCVWNVPVFDWVIDFENVTRGIKKSEEVPSIGLEYILLGMEMHTPKYELINKICSGVFCDFILSKKDIEISSILKKIFNSEQNCVGRKASVLYEFIKGVISKNHYALTQDIITWLSKTIKELSIQQENISDPIFLDINDRVYHIQQCHDAIHLLCKNISYKDAHFKSEICNLLGTLFEILNNDLKLKEKVIYNNCHCINS